MSYNIQNINSMKKGNALAPGATQYHAQFGLQDKGHSIIGLVV